MKELKITPASKRQKSKSGRTDFRQHGRNDAPL